MTTVSVSEAPCLCRNTRSGSTMGTCLWIRPPNSVTAFPHNATHTTQKHQRHRRRNTTKTQGNARSDGESLRRTFSSWRRMPGRSLRRFRDGRSFPEAAPPGVPLSRHEQTWWTVYLFFATLSEVFFTSVGLLSRCSGTKVVLLHDFRPSFVGQCPLSSRGLSPVFCVLVRQGGTFVMRDVFGVPYGFAPPFFFR
jgi:hypothetical protein